MNDADHTGLIEHYTQLHDEALLAELYLGRAAYRYPDIWDAIATEVLKRGLHTAEEVEALAPGPVGIIASFFCDRCQASTSPQSSGRKGRVLGHSTIPIGPTLLGRRDECPTCGSYVARLWILVGLPLIPLSHYRVIDFDDGKFVSRQIVAESPGPESPSPEDSDEADDDPFAPDPFVTLSDYTDPIEAGDAAATLDQHGIVCVIEREHETLNPAFTLKTSFGAIHLKVRGSEVSRAAEILQPEHAGQPASETDDLIADFTNQELLDVMAKPDEWDPETVRAADRLLWHRGVVVTDRERAELWERRLQEIRAPRPGDVRWIIVGFGLAFAGGIAGIFIGMGYRFLKARDPLGDAYYIYDEVTKGWGMLMMIVGIVVFVTSITLLLVG